MCFDNEQLVISKAAMLGLQPPPYRMHEQPERWTAWADRVARADQLRHAGKPFEDALDDCDRLGCPMKVSQTVIIGIVRSDGMDMLARAFAEVSP